LSAPEKTPQPAAPVLPLDPGHVMTLEKFKRLVNELAGKK
jgi:hypothetical protein